MYDAMGCARLWDYGMTRMNTTGIILTSWILYFSREAGLRRIVCYIENGRPERLSNLAKVTQLVGGREDKTNLKTILLPVNQRFSDSGLRAPLYFQQLWKTHQELLFIWVKSVNMYCSRNYNKVVHLLRTMALQVALSFSDSEP